MPEPTPIDVNMPFGTPGNTALAAGGAALGVPLGLAGAGLGALVGGVLGKRNNKLRGILRGLVGGGFLGMGAGIGSGLGAGFGHGLVSNDRRVSTLLGAGLGTAGAGTILAGAYSRDNPDEEEEGRRKYAQMDDLHKGLAARPVRPGAQRAPSWTFGSGLGLNAGLSFPEAAGSVAHDAANAVGGVGRGLNAIRQAVKPPQEQQAVQGFKKENAALPTRHTPPANPKGPSEDPARRDIQRDLAGGIKPSNNSAEASRDVPPLLRVPDPYFGMAARDVWTNRVALNTPDLLGIGAERDPLFGDQEARQYVAGFVTSPHQGVKPNGPPAPSAPPSPPSPFSPPDLVNRPWANWIGTPGAAPQQQQAVQGIKKTSSSWLEKLVLKTLDSV